MCGIAGFWQFKSYEKHSAADNASAMTEALLHRGPDDGGVWTQEDIALGQRRLSIVDLSPSGHQPMTSKDGRHVLVFNGEIYNYQTLANQLKQEGCVFEARNDTIVLSEACRHWGVERTLPKLNGMFVFAFYDTKERILMVARDRFGEKPLYYTHKNGDFFAFGSELKALHAIPNFDRSIDDNALSLYLRFNYIPGPYSIYKDSRKLFPGHYLTITEKGIHDEAYFDLEAEISQRTTLDLPETEIVTQLEEYLRLAVKERTIADVPIGAFLSGGIDSTLMVAIMQSQSSRPIKTFTVGFKNSPWDESYYAETIAKHLKTDHITCHIEPESLLECVENITRIYDEPFGDASALSTYTICKQFRKHVTVAIGGDGGDELFAGYHRHKWVPRLYRMGYFIPSPILSLFDRAAKCIPSERYPVFSGKVNKALRALKGKSFFEVYANSVTYWNTNKPLDSTWFKPHRGLLNDAEQVMFLDMCTFLHDDVLCKVDRASMATSLETRAPFLDYNLSDFAWRIPLSQKFKGCCKKYLLKKVLAKYVPQKLWDRPKMGFGMPLAEAFRVQLRATFERYLKADTPLWNHLDKATVQQLWRQHLSKKITHENLLWNVFVAQQFFLRDHS